MTKIESGPPFAHPKSIMQFFFCQTEKEFSKETLGLNSGCAGSSSCGFKHSHPAENGSTVIFWDLRRNLPESQSPAHYLAKGCVPAGRGSVKSVEADPC